MENKIVIDGRRYIASPNNKAFLAALNKIRKSEEPPESLKLFKFSQGTYALNPVLSGRGSQSALVLLDMKSDGKLSKKGEKQQLDLQKHWGNRNAFLKAGVAYTLVADALYDLELTNFSSKRPSALLTTTRNPATSVCATCKPSLQTAQLLWQALRWARLRCASLRLQTTLQRKASASPLI